MYELGISSTDAIEIKPLWDYKVEDFKREVKSRTLIGKLYKATYGHYPKFDIDVEVVTSEHMTIINSWWESNAELLLFITSDSVTEINSVVLMNKDTPINRYYKNTGYFKGSIELEGY